MDLGHFGIVGRSDIVHFGRKLALECVRQIDDWICYISASVLCTHCHCVQIPLGHSFDFRMATHRLCPAEFKFYGDFCFFVDLSNHHNATLFRMCSLSVVFGGTFITSSGTILKAVFGDGYVDLAGNRYHDVDGGKVAKDE